MKQYGISLSLFPASWRVGEVRRKVGKLVWALGPVRVTLHGPALAKAEGEIEHYGHRTSTFFNPATGEVRTVRDPAR